MKSNILLTVYTLIICQSTAQRAFCPVKSPSNQVIYFTDKPSWSATSLLKTQCTMECSFCSSKQTCGDCRAFNYNSTSQNCSIFNFEPKSYDIDSKGEMVGYRDNSLPVPGFWSTVAAKLCAIFFNGLTYTGGCTHVYKADKYCGVDRHYCKLLNGTEAFCLPDKSTITGPSLPANCSFPFTYNGTLYVGCAPGVGCLTARRTVVSNCNTPYVVPNVTVYVTVPALNLTVPLMSIYPWMIILVNIDTSFPLQQTYQVYQDGFGSPTSNFWLGLNRVYFITNSAVNGGYTYRLRVELLSAANSIDRWYSLEYDWFYLESLATNFKFRASTSATGDAIDYINREPISPVNGSPFTMSGSCASTFGPWWYTTEGQCCYCRLLGSSGGLAWYGIDPLKSARMLIRLVY